MEHDADTGRLSQGCEWCQHGGWLCIFLTYECDAGCHFCQAPYDDDRVHSELGSTLEDVLAGLERWEYRGVSFSGGDPFLVYPRMLTWLRALKERFPYIYYWAYTPGTHVSPGQLRELNALGMDEIRFNIAATGYDDPAVLKLIGDAVETFRHVAVEIPSIPRDHDLLTSILPELDDIGVEYLNLHEYILNPGSAVEMEGRAIARGFNYSGELLCDRKSIDNSSRIKRFCDEADLKISVNSCTVSRKNLQMLQRRLLWASRTKKAWELVTRSGLLATSVRTADLEKFASSHTLSAKLLYLQCECFNPLELIAGRDGYQTVFFLPPMETGAERVFVGTSEEIDEQEEEW